MGCTVGRPLSWLLLVLAVSGAPAAAQVLDGSRVPQSAAGQDQAGQDKQPDKPLRDKSSLTKAQRKLDAHLLDEIDLQRSNPRRTVRTSIRRAIVDVDADGRALVEIRGRIPAQLGWKIERLKGTVVSSSLEHRSVIAWVPLLKLESLASEATVSAITPAPKSVTVRPQDR